MLAKKTADKLWIRFPKDVCLRWNQEKRKRSDYEYNIMYATCRGGHVIKKYSDSSKKHRMRRLRALGKCAISC